MDRTKINAWLRKLAGRTRSKYVLIDGWDIRWCDAAEACRVNESGELDPMVWHRFPGFGVKYHPQCCPVWIGDQTCGLPQPSNTHPGS
jgi:hypothetical protein